MESFILEGFKDYGIAKRENLNSIIDGYKIYINNDYKKGEFNSQAEVKMNPNFKNVNLIYYNGNEFKVIK